MIAVDTSIVVRYLTGTPPHQALRARAFVDGTDRLGVSIVVLLETGYVLRSRYGVRRQAVVETLLDFVARANIEILGLPKHAVVEALAKARSFGDAPIAEALIAAMAREAGATSMASFDGGIGRHGLDVVEP